MGLETEERTPTPQRRAPGLDEVEFELPNDAGFERRMRDLDARIGGRSTTSAVTAA
jgi:hypothetical protein